MTFRPLLPTLALLLLLAPGAALAQPSDADRSLARTLANEGYDALDRKDYAAAAERFGRADGLYHVPTVALGLARAQAGLGRLVQAEETYHRIVREGAPAGAPAPILKAVADARRELDALAPRIAGLVITVSGPAAAQVTVDGAPVAAAALGVRLPVNPGQHVVVASAASYGKRSLTVMAPEGRSVNVPIELRPEPQAATPPPPGPAPGVTSPPPVTAPVPAPPAPRADEGPPPAPWSGQKIAGAALMGGSAVGAVLGGVFAAQAKGKFNDLAKQCPTHTGCDPSLGPALSSYHATSTASVASFVAGGLVLGTGIVLFVTAPKAKATHQPLAFVAPRLGAGWAGVEGGF